tara:strand:+ start:2356 stop:3357 length:1002 start_codon:yes stop_codon:yes gene_type:complete
MAKTKKNTAGNYDTYRANISLKPTQQHSSQNDPLTNQIKDIDKLINLNIKLKQLEGSGMKDMADEIREANGIKKVSETPKNNENYTMLMNMWMSETDETKKEQLQKMMMMENMKNSSGNGNDSMSQMMFMTMMSPNQKREEPKKSEIETLLLQSTLNQLTNQMGKDPIEALVKYQDMMGKLNTGQGELANFFDVLEKGKQVGLVSDSAPSLEDRKLSLEEKRLDNEMELKKLDNDREAGTKSDTVNALTSIATSFLQGKSDNKAPAQEEQKQPEPDIEHIEGQCATCNNKINFTHPENSRDITCENCDEKYHWDSKKQEMEYSKSPQDNNTPV